MKMIKKLLITVNIVILTAVSLSICAFSDSSADPDLKGKIKVNGECLYETSSDMYVYYLGNSEIKASLPSGAVTNSSVKFATPEGMICKVYRGGEQMDIGPLKEISSPGSYVIKFGDRESISLNYVIVQEISNLAAYFKIPSGFSVKEAYFNGESIPGSQTINMTADGEYEIKYVCNATGKEYSLHFVSDHTAPTLTFEGLENNTAKNPVKVYKDEDDTTVTVTRDGKEIEFSERYTTSGKYELTVTDKAGNFTKYTFLIKLYFNLNSVTVFVVLGIVILALIIYVLRARKKLRVR